MTKSCGCLQRESVAKKNFVHGMTYSAAYGSWADAKKRVTNQNTVNYGDYGARNIKMCDRWLNSFKNFLADMGDRPAGMSLERKDVNGDYCPENCVWANRQTQNLNQRRTKRVMWAGESVTICELEKRMGYGKNLIRYRLKCGWPLDKAVTTPANFGNRKGVKAISSSQPSLPQVETEIAALPSNPQSERQAEPTQLLNCNTHR
jgi:hypothetical protein